MWFVTILFSVFINQLLIEVQQPGLESKRVGGLLLLICEWLCGMKINMQKLRQVKANEW